MFVYIYGIHVDTLIVYSCGHKMYLVSKKKFQISFFLNTIINSND